MFKEEIINKQFILTLDGERNVYASVLVGEVSAGKFFTEEILVYRKVDESDYDVVDDELKRQIDDNFFVQIATITE
jgi:hypothetical protein